MPSSLVCSAVYTSWVLYHVHRLQRIPENHSKSNLDLPVAAQPWPAQPILPVHSILLSLPPSSRHDFETPTQQHLNLPPLPDPPTCAQAHLPCHYRNCIKCIKTSTLHGSAVSELWTASRSLVNPVAPLPMSDSCCSPGNARRCSTAHHSTAGLRPWVGCAPASLRSPCAQFTSTRACNLSISRNPHSRHRLIQHFK